MEFSRKLKLDFTPTSDFCWKVKLNWTLPPLAVKHRLVWVGTVLAAGRNAGNLHTPLVLFHVDKTRSLRINALTQSLMIV